MNTLNIKNIFLIIFIATGLLACGVDVGGSEDKNRPSVTLTSLNSAEEVIGTFNLIWTTDDPNPSTVDIYLSSDSGATYPTVVGINIPDTGSYSWDTNTVDDCRNCRLRIIPQDVVGNVGEPAESAKDFIINNVPQVLGVAYYYDLDNNGFGAGDEIRVPFDKELELRTSIASDIFFFPVLGDNIGAFSKVRKGANPKELIVTMNDIDPQNNYRLHIHGAFKPENLGLTFPSGINLQDNISEGIIYAPDTGRTAMTAEQGIDILLPIFSDSGQTLGSSFTDSIALGDVDGDGDLDIVEASYSGTNLVWLNGGDNSGSNTGIFTDSGQTLGNNGSRSIALGDIDGDGDLDMVVGNSTINSINGANRVWLNGGDNSGSNTGIFTDSGQTLGNSNTQSIALGDVDGDGDLDIVTGNGAANRIWLNGGDNSGSNTGIFTDSGQELGNNYTRSIALGDADGDGDLDIVEGRNGDNRIWLNGGDSSGSNKGVFTDSGQSLGNSNTNSIALGDVDGDGDLDLVAGNSDNVNNANRIWLNGGDSSGSNTGVFADSGQTLGNSNTQSITLGDVDEDGDLDIVVGNKKNTTQGGFNRVFLNGGDGSGSNTGVFADSDLMFGNSSTYSLALALGDVDGDGDLDMVAGNSGINYVWLNSLRYVPADPMLDTGQALGRSAYSIALGDVDGDDDLDMVIGNGSYDDSRILLNGGDSSGSNTGVFIDSGQALGNARSITVGDIDGDGDLDIIGSGTVWFNGGDNSGSNTGLFTEGQTNNFDLIVLGDVDGDGDLDVVAGNDDFSANGVWLNGGDNSGSNTGIFTDSGQALGSDSTRAIALGDVDGDGDLDIVAGNVFDIRIWLNGSDNSGSNTGVFADSGQALGNNTGSIALGDVDGDGDLDIVAGGNNINGNAVWLNGGDNTGTNTGIFTNSGQSLGTNAQSIVLGDMDGDGDLDVVMVGRNIHSMWLNRGSNTGTFFDSGQQLGNAESYIVALGDLGGSDGPDIVVGSADISIGNTEETKVWLNDF